MAFSLPALPYSTTALAANGMCQETLELHHGKHHNAYVTALNGLIEAKGLAGKSLEAICAEAGKAGADGLPVLNQAGQHYNHILFWQVMQPGGGGDKLPGALAAKIDSDLGGMAAFKEAFKQAGVTQFGSGWAWLYVGADKKLAIGSTANQDSPLMGKAVAGIEGKPVLGLDVWEHAYYLNYQNRRPDYVTAWWNVVDWDAAEANYQAAIS